MSQLLIHRRFEAWAGDRPNAVAVETAIERLTYGELDHRANQVARALLASGVRPDMPVGLFAERSIESVVATLGILKAGGACYPIDLQQCFDGAHPLFHEARLPIIVAQRHLMPRMASVPATVICLDVDRISACASAPAAAITGDSLAYVVGSTDSNGKSVGVEIVHHSIARLIGQNAELRLGADDVLPLIDPLTSTATIFGVWGALLHGGRITISSQPTLSNRDIACFVRRRKVTIFSLSAKQVEGLVDEFLDDMSCLRQLIVFGALPPVYVGKLRSRHPSLRLLGAYSPIDSVPPSCYFGIDEGSSDALHTPIGRPLDGVLLAVLDEQGQPTVDSRSGELCLGGSILPRGYRNRPDLNAARFVPHPFEPGVRLYRTGDRVRLRDDGILEFLGRLEAQAALPDACSDHAAIEAA